MRSAVILSTFLLSILPLAADSSTAQGDYFEVRSNHVYTCGCLYSGEMVTSGQEAILTWNIRRADLFGESLGPFQVVAVVVAPLSLSLEDTPRKSALYLEGISGPGHEQAVLKWLQQRYSALLGEIVAVNRETIRFVNSGDRVDLQVGNKIRIQARTTVLPEDAHLGSLLWYEPFVPLKNPQLRTVVHEEYQGSDFPRRWRRQEERITAFSGEFVLP